MPIALVYSITIHKAQGLTLQRVEVDPFKKLNSNRLRGIVSSLSIKCVTINFTGLNGEILTANLKAETILAFICNENRVIASRQQMPIALVYSITIHKAQGSTLQRVEVDASNFFSAWQALGCFRDEGNSMDTIGNSNLDDELLDFGDGEIEEIDFFLLSKDTDITERCEQDQIQELFIDLTEISALFSDLNTTPIDTVHEVIK
ncbi:Hypothetical predicted protein [Mytilus galloprovincialis]|uniref:Uncharacterized protein n=1 Tax=Mytilus galloprovincialis TaxID=29158 RepID=A0A8B6E5S9_MYTGA|nr:Hypothetical predicted protein [Mytilus galloprovincialis]